MERSQRRSERGSSRSKRSNDTRYLLSRRSEIQLNPRVATSLCNTCYELLASIAHGSDRADPHERNNDPSTSFGVQLDSSEACPAVRHLRPVECPFPRQVLLIDGSSRGKGCGTPSGHVMPPASGCGRGNRTMRKSLSVRTGGRLPPSARRLRSGYSGDTDPVNPVGSIEANSAEHSRLDSLPYPDCGDDSTGENCAKSAWIMGCRDPWEIVLPTFDPRDGLLRWPQ